MTDRKTPPIRTLACLATAAFAGLCFFTQLPAMAMDINDVLELKKANLGDEVILAQATAEHADFHLKTDEIKRLKAAGASDALILGLMKSATAAAVAVPIQTPVAPAQAPVAAPAAVMDAPVNQADLELEMLDQPDLDIAVNPDTRTILLAPAGQLGGTQAGSTRQAWRLSAGKRLSVVIAAGTYKVYWINEETSYPVNLDTRSTAKLIFSTTSTKMYDAVYLSIFRGDTRVDGGRLHMLEVKPTAFAPQASTASNDYNPAQAQREERVIRVTEPPATSAAYTTGTSYATASEPTVSTQVVTRTVYVDQPVYVERPVYYSTAAPVYVAPACTTRYVYSSSCAPVYRAPYCAPRYDSCNSGYRAPSYSSYYRRSSCSSGYAGVSFSSSGRHGGLSISLGGFIK